MKNHVEVRGKVVDDETRCVHYHSRLDVIAIKFKCCEAYYPCYRCHGEEATHEPLVWNKDEWDTKAVLCGVCGGEMSISDYLNSDSTCPFCGAEFNPNCSKHYPLYFNMNE